ENAAAGLLSFVGTVTIVDDDDEHLSRSDVGFRGRVVQEGSPDWQNIASPDAIVRFYDPTDVFGDLAEALVDAYSAVAEVAEGGDAADGPSNADHDDDADDDDDDEEDGDEFDDEGDESESDKR